MSSRDQQLDNRTNGNLPSCLLITYEYAQGRNPDHDEVWRNNHGSASDIVGFLVERNCYPCYLAGWGRRPVLLLLRMMTAAPLRAGKGSQLGPPSPLLSQGMGKLGRWPRGCPNTRSVFPGSFDAMAHQMVCMPREVVVVVVSDVAAKARPQELDARRRHIPRRVKRKEGKEIRPCRNCFA